MLPTSTSCNFVVSLSLTGHPHRKNLRAIIAFGFPPGGALDTLPELPFLEAGHQVSLKFVELGHNLNALILLVVVSQHVIQALILFAYYANMFVQYVLNASEVILR